MTVKIIKAEDFGIEKNQEKELLSNLPQIKKERSEFERQYDKVINMDIEDPETWKTARDLRLKIRDNRTKGINAWHRTAKDYFLKGGQFVDAIRRMEIAVNERMEESLSKIENHEDIVKQREVDRLNELRMKQIEPYSEFIPFGIKLGELPEEEYVKVFNGAKLQHEAKMEAIRKEEAERKERERIEKLRNKRSTELQPYYDFVIIPEGDDLGAIGEKEYSKIKADAVKKKEDHIKEQEEIRKEKERLEAQMKKEKEAAEKKLATELEARKKAEKELWEAQKKIKAAQEKKAKEEKARKEAERQKKLAPDKEKMMHLKEEISAIVFPELKTDEYREILKLVMNHLKESCKVIESLMDEEE